MNSTCWAPPGPAGPGGLDCYLEQGDTQWRQLGLESSTEAGMIDGFWTSRSFERPVFTPDMHI